MTRSSIRTYEFDCDVGEAYEVGCKHGKAAGAAEERARNVAKMRECAAEFRRFFGEGHEGSRRELKTTAVCLEDLATEIETGNG